ncbi:MAG: helix-turn-helix domain-containing protein [Actinobacteria bacterium]|nr:helix-turn-helix domain-containing protein [Actinomycetota bacterium]
MEDKNMSLLSERASSPDPAEGLQAVAALSRLLNELETLHVINARRSGWSWREIADHLGVTKQTVHRKHHGAC